MAAVAPLPEQAADLLQNLSLDSKPKTIEVPEATKKPSVDPSNFVNGVQSDRSLTPSLPDYIDPAMCYVPNAYPSTPYYYSGYDLNEDYSRYLNQDGVDMNTGAYGDSASLMYHPYSYAPYAPYSPAVSPVPTLGNDGQMYGAQQYQYPYFQSSTPGGLYPSSVAPAKGEIPTSMVADQLPLSVDSSNAKSNGVANIGGAKGNNGTVSGRLPYQNSSYNVNGSYGKGSLAGAFPASGYQDPRFGFDGMQWSMPWLESPYFSDGYPRPLTNLSRNSSISNGNYASRNQNQPHLMGLHHPMPMAGMNTANGYINSMASNKYYGRYGNSYRSNLGYGSNGYDSRARMSVDSKYKLRGRGNGLYGYVNESTDGLNELNRGPRAKITKNPKGFMPVALAVKGQDIPVAGTTDDEKQKLSVIPDQEKYNRPEFAETCSDAKFFIIKSYSEDDVHKSIKYNVWSSTPNGNKKLDAAYSEAQQKSGDCPVFLFFSVNTSGQFVGVAEMVGPVDFNKNVEYWQQDKWIGCFPVTWHIVKDLPNNLLKHIILENNENKPVTNSRDTQEVKLDQGLEMLKIFKDHLCKQCILDDFDFYEDRQKRIQEKKAKQQQFQKQQAQQVWENKPSTDEKSTDSKDSNSDVKPHKSPEVASDFDKEAASAVLANGDNSAVLKSGDIVKTTIPAAIPEKKPLTNGVANGC